MICVISLADLIKFEDLLGLVSDPSTNWTEVQWNDDVDKEFIKAILERNAAHKKVMAIFSDMTGEKK